MQIETFWQIIELAKAKSRSSEEQVAIIEHTLLGLPPEEIQAFDDILSDLRREAYLMPLWDEMQRIVGFCSDDGFAYFRCWLIAQGQHIYQAVVHNPVILREFVMKETDWHLECLLSAACKAYEQKTGQDFYADASRSSF